MASFPGFSSIPHLRFFSRSIPLFLPPLLNLLSSFAGLSPTGFVVNFNNLVAQFVGSFQTFRNFMHGKTFSGLVASISTPKLAFQHIYPSASSANDVRHVFCASLMRIVCGSLNNFATCLAVLATLVVG